MKNNLLNKLKTTNIIQQTNIPSAAKMAAIIAPIVNKQNESFIYLIQRPEHLYEHGGEIGFPGGKIEEHDATPLIAAKREFEEELGVSAQLLDIINELPIHCTLSGRYCIYPFIALLPITHQLHPNQNEVETIISLPLQFILNDNNWGKETISRHDKQLTFDVLYYDKFRIWGVSARILLTIKHLLSA
jgi:8-oxo-dGTP pyrophosphatase MutT (NUDIX family)